MNIFESVRGLAFRTIDTVKGARIGKHIKDLEAAFKNPEKGRGIADTKLKELLAHACTTTGYYAQFSGKELSQFPVIQKRTIKENYDAFVSNAYDKDKLLTTTTSGSYGMPFTFYITPERDSRTKAEVIFFSRYAGYKLGMKFAMVRAQKRGWLTRFMQNYYLMNPCIIDQNWLETQRHLLRNKGVKFIIAYPSALVPLVEYCRTKGDRPEDFSVQGIITSAEPYSDIARQSFKEMFGCNILDRYASNEMGIMAHELTDEGVHYINFASHRIELLAMDSDEPINEPDRVGRVIVTDLFSQAMPLIRYDTGDLAMWAEPEKCEHDIPAFEKIEGRVVETLSSPEGKLISFSMIDIIPKYFSDIIQFQFIQKSEDKYVIKLHVMESFDQQEKLLQNCIDVFGPNAKFQIEYVDHIEPLPSGKRPYIVNEFKNGKIR